MSYMEVKEVDLRFKSRSCTDHPVVVFTRILRDLSRNRDKKVKIIAYKEDIPPKFIELFVEKHRLRLIRIKELGSGVIEALISP